MVVMGHASGSQAVFHESQPGREQQRTRLRLPQRLVRDPHADAALPRCAKSVVAPYAQQHRQQGRVQMEMFVRVDVVQLEASRREGIELSANLSFKLDSHMWQRKEA